jgi:hypothetical protein
MTIREIRPEEAAGVTDLYLEACRLLAELDPDSGVPNWDTINRWITRTAQSDQAVCLIKEVEGAIVGNLLASITPHPAMPGVLGTLEELHVRPGPDTGRMRVELVEAGIAWARAREASPIQTTVALDAPLTNEDLSFWTSVGFEHDQALVTRYFLEEEEEC